MSNFLARQKFRSFLKYIYYIIHTLYIYVYRDFSNTLDSLEKECQKRRDRQIGKHKLNEMGALDMK